MTKLTWHAFYMSYQGQWWNGISILQENKKILVDKTTGLCN